MSSLHLACLPLALLQGTAWGSPEVQPPAPSAVKKSHLPLSLAQANLILEEALKEARARNLAPLAGVVLDAGGNLVAFQREDGAGFARHPLAHAKAWGALGMGFGTRELMERAEKHPTFMATAAMATDGRLIPSPGGVLIRTPDGQVVGAVGISGDVGPQDEACAVKGIEAAKFIALPGAAGAP